ncbi:MAG TPA: helix-turn-helix domain-containing protein [Streptosporangiaceae bacterium]|jgi:AcrR family transcriptional regulator|nr:helix-turn-helix domain-containing protein [Streptosporangiaceae bacterium]
MPTPSPPAPPPGRPHARRATPATRATPADGAAADLREAILAATARLLADRSFASLAVSDILTAAGVSRGTFYFYFDSKHAVLGELVRRAVAEGHTAAAPWLAAPADPVAALRVGTAAGARLWQASAPVLRAIVENWRTDPRLTALWLEQMQSFTDAAVAQITADPRAQETLAGHDKTAIASALTWLSERLYYLAATSVPPFDDQDTLIDTLTCIWAAVLYRA